jgi:hypothetical protein
VPLSLPSLCDAPELFENVLDLLQVASAAFTRLYLKTHAAASHITQIRYSIRGRLLGRRMAGNQICDLGNFAFHLRQ